MFALSTLNAATGTASEVASPSEPGCNISVMGIRYTTGRSRPDSRGRIAQAGPDWDNPAPGHMNVVGHRRWSDMPYQGQL